MNVFEDGRTHYVYRLYDSNDQVLYVGCSINLKRRFNQHSSTQPWWPQVVRYEFEVFEAKWAGLIAEKVAIQRYQPAHNIVHRGINTAPDVLAHHDRISRAPAQIVELNREFQASRV